MVLAATPEELNMEIINTIAQEALVDMGIILHHQQLQLQPDTVQQDILLLHTRLYYNALTNLYDV